MASGRKAQRGGPVRVDGENVVLTVTPEQARVVATSLAYSNAVHDEWLDNMAHLLAMSAQRVEPTAVVTRGSFLRGRWDKGSRHVSETASRPRSNQQTQAVAGPAAVQAPNVVTDAAAAVAEAMAITVDARDDVAAEVQADLVAQAAATREQSVSVAADRTAFAAEAARSARAVAVASAAENVAETAARAADQIQLQAEGMAVKVAAAASDAASVVASQIPLGHDEEAALTAIRIAANVTAAAVVTAEETALAAAGVARAVAAAAAQAALAASSAAAAFEHEVANAAAAVQAVATATAHQVAAEAGARAAGVALTASAETAAEGGVLPSTREQIASW